jgi:hypothetical protein
VIVSEDNKDLIVGTGDNYPAEAMKLVKDFIGTRYEWGGEDVDFKLYVVWFAKELRNWKALVGTTLEDGMYYEITHDGTNLVTYLDAYKKVDNVVIPNKEA